MYVTNNTYVRWPGRRSIELDLKFASDQQERYCQQPWWKPGFWSIQTSLTCRRYFVLQWLGLCVWLYMPFPKKQKVQEGR